MAHVIRFGKRSDFDRDLRKSVDAHFERTGTSTAGGWRMWLKTAFLLSSLAGVVTAFLTLPFSWGLTIGLAVICGLVMAGIGFAVQHDANHGAYSKKKWVNRLVSCSLDILGASSYLWQTKHNRIHHAYTNVSHVDDDLDVGKLGRFAPDHERLWFHRYQQFYMWFLYSMLTIRWYFDDFVQLKNRRVAERTIKLPRGLDLAQFLFGKIFFLTWMIILPAIFVGVGPALVFYVLTEMVLGLTLAVIFQLAHCVESAQFVIPNHEGPTMLEVDFAQHQLAGTVDFARSNRLLTWYVGGLNYQVVHHLFPRISHVHYPAISKILQEVADRHGVTYRHVPTLRTAIAGHYRSLRRLGRGDDELAVAGVVEQTGQPASPTTELPEIAPAA
ncbi:MAG: fatty acid desaturase family protein [Bradymonadia bacterium]